MADNKAILFPAEPLPKIVIKPSRGLFNLRLTELWQYRELLYFLAWRDIKVRYKQTVVGAAWAIIQPFFTMIVFTLFFGNLAKMPSEGVPYPIFSYAGLLPWTFFAQAMNQSSDSLVANANLITKVYFPRLVIPLSAGLAPLVDFCIAFIVLIGMMFYYQIFPTGTLIWLPVFLLLAFATSLGVGLWLSALNVQYRDVRYTIPFLTQLWLFATPVIYPSGAVVHGPWRIILGLNPMTGVVEGFRWALLGIGTAPGTMIYTSMGVSLLLVFTGLMYFNRMEKTFADIV
ncbi:MAG TPA: ABC transporter permease [Thermodesulfobacteriota bacterium]|nr:ABC transporter permease [Thermodesulfobacteriota bacterium]